MIIDAYGHVSLPRFLSVEDFLRLMDIHGVEKAVLSTAETCPDLAELSRAAVAHPDRFRVVGMPLGRDPQHRRDAIRAQLDAGFSGIRLPAAFVADNPDVLDILGQAGAFGLFVGERGLAAAHGPIAAFLARYPDALAVAGHFGGPTDPALLDDASFAPLLADPRFVVAFTRHGAMRHLPVEDWARAVVARIGWGRVLWGSEWPVSLWRDESYRSTIEWADRLAPTATERAAFLGGNAERLFFAKPAPVARPIGPEWDLRPFGRAADVWLFPPSLDLPEARHRRLYHAYMAAGGEARGSYSAFVLDMVERGIAAEGE